MTLFSPISIGTMQLRNRIVMSPMETCYGTKHGAPSDQTIDYFEARARGGVGLITLGASTVDSQHREVPNSMDFGTTEHLDRHRELTDRIHAQGAKIQPQLVHPGPDGLAPYLSGIPNVGPSVIQSYLTGVACRELAEAEIEGIIAQYASAAKRVREGGYDGIELHAAHGYMLLGSFLSPVRNRRTDTYAGGDPEGRVRLIHEVVRAIKRSAGADFPITLRVSGYERDPGGRTSYDTARMAPSLVESGVDAFHVSGGVIDRLTTQMVSGAVYGPGHNLAAAAAVRLVVDVPVMAVGRIHDPALAHRILDEDRADLVAMGRPLLADADLPRKLKEGRTAELRLCISCQNCIDSMETRGRMSCAVNAQTGREGELPFTPTDHPRSVLVVGGGPAGLEAARVAALRGHRVMLREREGFLGGALVMAATVHPDNEPLLTYLKAELARLDVDVATRTEVGPEEVRKLGADVVIVATGGRVVAPEVPGRELPHVLTGAQMRQLIAGRLPSELRAKLPAWQRLGVQLVGGSLQSLVEPRRLRSVTRIWMPLGKRVVVVGGDLAAVELSEFLAERGRQVTLVEAGPEIASEVGLKRRTEHMDRLDRLGVPVVTGVAVERIESEAVRLPGGRRVPADSVILAGEVEADTSLYTALSAAGHEVHAVGDCTGLGLIVKAIEEGARAACAI